MTNLTLNRTSPPTTVYLDHQASTPMDERVFDAMLPWALTVGDPDAGSVSGKRARDAVEKANTQVAWYNGADPKNVIFTLGAMEATKTALRGLMLRPGSRCLTFANEHPCVHETLADLSTYGVETTIIPVSAVGIVGAKSGAHDATGWSTGLTLIELPVPHHRQRHPRAVPGRQHNRIRHLARQKDLFASHQVETRGSATPETSDSDALEVETSSTPIERTKQ